MVTDNKTPPPRHRMAGCNDGVIAFKNSLKVCRAWAEFASENERRASLIGNLLDRWDMTPNDLKEEMREHGCGKQLDELLRHVEAPSPQPRDAVQ